MVLSGMMIQSGQIQMQQRMEPLWKWILSPAQQLEQFGILTTDYRAGQFLIQHL